MWCGEQSHTRQSEGMGLGPARSLTHCMTWASPFPSLELRFHVRKIKGLSLNLSKGSSISEDQAPSSQTCELRFQAGLPWWRSGWESACQCRGHGFEPWSGRIPHAAEQLGPWATTTEPARLEHVLRNKRGRNSERPAHRDNEWPPLAATRESPRTETKTQHSQK